VKTDEPIPPEDETVSPEVEAIIRERLKTFEEGKKTAIPWPEAKRQILDVGIMLAMWLAGQCTIWWIAGRDSTQGCWLCRSLSPYWRYRGHSGAVDIQRLDSERRRPYRGSSLTKSL
jgi:hypothetical protein